MPVKRKSADGALRTNAKVAPAVGLLLFGEHALASDAPDIITDEDFATVPEPSTLALLAVGAAAAGVAHAVKKRRKK